MANNKWMNVRPEGTLTIPDAATQLHPGNDGMTEVNRMRIIPEKISAKASSKVSGVAANLGLRMAKTPAAPYKIALRTRRPMPLQPGTKSVVPKLCECSDGHNDADGIH